MKKIMAGFGLAAVMLIVSATGVKAAGNVAVNAKNFPDQIFRTHISEYVDADKNGALSKTEIAKTTSIDVMHMDIKNLKGIQYFTNLEELICNSNQLKKLDVSKNTKLTHLNCSDNKLTKLDLSKNKKLDTVYCGENKLTSLDLSKNTKLEELMCNNNKLTKLNFSKNKKLSYVYCDKKVTVTGYKGEIVHP